MSCIFSPVPASRCVEQRTAEAGEEVSATMVSPALAPLLIAVILLACVLMRTIRGRRRPW